MLQDDSSPARLAQAVGPGRPVVRPPPSDWGTVLDAGGTNVGQTAMRCSSVRQTLIENGLGPHSKTRQPATPKEFPAACHDEKDEGEKSSVTEHENQAATEIRPAQDQEVRLL